MPEQQIIVLDSQILSSIQQCPRRTNFAFVQNITPIQKAEPLERGDQLHKMLEFYYGVMGKCINPNSDIWTAIKAIGWMEEHIQQLYNEWNHSVVVETAVRLGRFHATTLTLPAEEVEEVIFHFREYTNHFRHDKWNPLAVEEAGLRVIHEDAFLKVVYTFKVDMIAEQGNMVIPWDHKHAKRKSDPNPMENQFMGYCYCLDKSTLMINKVGFQKTVSARDRFQRQLVSYDKERLEEWRVNTVKWARILNNHRAMDDWPMVLTSCEGRYSRCPFYDICDNSPSARPWIIETKYKQGKPWDVTKGLV